MMIFNLPYYKRYINLAPILDILSNHEILETPVYNDNNDDKNISVK